MLLIFYSIAHYLLIIYNGKSVLACNSIMFIVTYIRLLIPLLVITEKLIESEKKLRVYNDRLNAMNITRKSFTRTLTHDIKSPIFTSMGYLDLIKQEKMGSISDNIKNILEKIINSNKTIVEIIDLINEFVQQKTDDHQLKLKKIDLSEIVHKIFNQLNIFSEKKCDINIDQNNKIFKNDLSIVYKILFILFNKLSECSDELYLTSSKKNELLRVDIRHNAEKKHLNDIIKFLKEDSFKINSIIQTHEKVISIYFFDYN